MFRLITACLVVLLTSAIAAAQPPVRVLPTNYQAVSFEEITIDATAKRISAGVLTPSGGAVQFCIVTIETADVRYREDGTDPTATTGHPTQQGKTLQITGFEILDKWRVIRTGSTSAKGTVTCYRRV